MNYTELIRKTVNLEPIGETPFALLSAGAWAINRQGASLEETLRLPPETAAQWLFEGYTLADSAISWVGSGYNNIVIKAVGGKIKWRRSGTPDAAEPRLKTLEEAGGLNPADVAKDKDVQTVYETVKRLTEKENGQRLVGGSMWAPFTLAGLLTGADALMRSVYKNPEAAHKVLRAATELYLEYMRGYVEAGARVIFMADPSASGDMISRKHFEGFALPYIKEAFKRLKDKTPDIIAGLHICGDTSDRLDLIAESGARIMSLDYKVPIEKAREGLGGKIAFSGNLNPVTVVQNGTDEEIRREVLSCVEKAGGVPGYIVMPGCDIPPLTPLENLQAISKTVREYNDNRSK
ncbi:MAG: uroporphyrinogen decarboxylase family protein [Oscillospiraceae bacterium]|jgi:uroporphyrinogen decarboxylase|nr:uroporphyrinogen decarboxylase family protein [Oscillospiraceae bacterium]